MSVVAGDGPVVPFVHMKSDTPTPGLSGRLESMLKKSATKALSLKLRQHVQLV